MSYTKRITKLIVFILMLCLFSTPVEAKNKIKLNHKSITLRVGATSTLKLKHAKGKVKWKSKKTKIVQVSKKGKIKAKKKGKTTIVANYKGKQYKCKVIVKAKKNKDTPLVEKQNQCNHEWKEIMKTEHHDAVYEERMVKDCVVYHYYCRNCEKWYPEITDDPCDGANGGTGSYPVSPAEYETVCVQEAFDEQVGTGRYECTKCRMIK